MSNICPKGSFIIEQKGESCISTATRLPLRFARGRVGAINKHIKEEGEN